VNVVELKSFLDAKVDLYNRIEFIEKDPIYVPHQFSKKQDIEIAGFIAAMFAWGQRVTIINKSMRFLELMDHAPYDFVVNYTEEDLKRFLGFVHRTFNEVDALYFLQFFQWFYRQYESLEEAFLIQDRFDAEKSLIAFANFFFSLADHPKRTYKHIPNPARNSACKRMNMYLRWMVRKDRRSVDFGLWKKIKPHQLICPCDLHVDRVARTLGLITRKQTDWQTAVELTESLKLLDPHDPVKYDFALFGLGIEEKY
jgi:uncharacterized protein (TIGR02757 family)